MDIAGWWSEVETRCLPHSRPQEEEPLGIQADLFRQAPQVTEFGSVLHFILSERCRIGQDILDTIPGGGAVWRFLENSLF